jgi:hypothetical protein
MATSKQVQAAKQNVKKAQRAASQKRTIANLPESTRRGLGKQAARGRRRGGQAGHALERKACRMGADSRVFSIVMEIASVQDSLPHSQRNSVSNRGSLPCSALFR